MSATVINFFGGPGVGKSTLASGLFYLFKKEGLNCELINEYAKRKVWEESYKVLDNQLYVLGKQSHAQFICKNKVDYIITDSPILMSIYYGQKYKTGASLAFQNMVREVFNSYHNINVFVEKGSDSYDEDGRIETKEEALEVHNGIKTLLNDEGAQYFSFEREDDINFLARKILEGAS